MSVAADQLYSRERDLLYTVPHKMVRENFKKLNDTDSLPKESHEVWDSLARLLLCVWFSRLWTYQEVVVSNDVIVCCGSLSCTLEDFTRAVVCLGDDHGLLENQNNASRTAILTITDARIERRKDQGYSLLLLLANTRNADNCKLPHDRIYALLGIQKRSTQLDIEVDYNKPLAGVMPRWRAISSKEALHRWFCVTLIVYLDTQIPIGRRGCQIEATKCKAFNWTGVPTLRTSNLPHMGHSQDTISGHYPKLSFIVNLELLDDLSTTSSK
jgi:hypothetical protein